MIIYSTGSSPVLTHLSEVRHSKQRPAVQIFAFLFYISTVYMNISNLLVMTYQRGKKKQTNKIKNLEKEQDHITGYLKSHEPMNRKHFAFITYDSSAISSPHFTLFCLTYSNRHIRSIRTLTFQTPCIKIQ